MTAPFNRAAAEKRLGPVAVLAVRAVVAEAPPLSSEIRMRIKDIFDSSRAVTAPAPSRSLAA